jgi:hypothetical protein
MLEEVWHILKADFNQIDITYDLLKEYIYFLIPSFNNIHFNIKTLSM